MSPPFGSSDSEALEARSIESHPPASSAPFDVEAPRNTARVSVEVLRPSRSSMVSRVSSTLALMAAGGVLTLIVMLAAESGRTRANAQERFRATESPSFAAGSVAGPGLGRQRQMASDLSEVFHAVAINIRSSVVAISTRTVETIPGRRLPPGMPRELAPFFGGSMGPRQRESEGMGSGVIVRSDGYILTNNHVVEGADELTVEMSDGEMIPGEIVGTDPQTDLAVIKIDRTDLPAAIMGDSDRVRVGDWVMAIGSPFGLDQTVTAGIISGKNRVQAIIDEGRGFEDFLQTDAAINPGNSGGPLVNLDGQLIGINTAILSRSGGNAGIGFAIPVSMAKPILESIIETGEVQRGFLGARVVDLTAQLREQFDIREKRGAFIEEVLAGKPAARAGLVPGDLVTAIEGRPCVGGTQLRTFVASRRPGQTFRITVVRGGKPFDATIRLDMRTDEAMSLFGTGEVMGAKLVPVTPSTAKQYGYAEDQTGLLVTEVGDGSAAAQIGLEIGDIIESAGPIELSDAEQLSTILQIAAEQDEVIRVIIRRGDRRIMVPLRSTAR